MKTNKTFLPMDIQTTGYLVIFGVFLTLVGLAGYLTHPEKAYTALIAGGGFGALWILWGILNARDIRGMWLAAVGTTVLLGLASAWRAGVNWLAVLNGQGEKAFTASLITLMLVLSAAMLFLLARDRKTVSHGKTTGEF